ncbi:MAG TPA: hypothetical protein VHG29_13195 [Novosphingobium sp.]|nr:hypothetical protein [Novosphingobium sp.]
MVRAFLLATLLLVPVGYAQAAEKGLVIRAGDLMAQPFIDAAKTGPVTPNQPVTILERRGGWANVETGGRNGWIRLLNVRLEPRPATAATGQRASGPSVSAITNPASLLRTGSSGRTVTTGVKGMDEEDIRNASPDPVQLLRLGTLGVDAATARAHAQKSNLKENALGYLDKGRGR